MKLTVKTKMYTIIAVFIFISSIIIAKIYLQNQKDAISEEFQTITVDLSKSDDLKLAILSNHKNELVRIAKKKAKEEGIVSIKFKNKKGICLYEEKNGKNTKVKEIMLIQKPINMAVNTKNDLKENMLFENIDEPNMEKIGYVEIAVDLSSLSELKEKKGEILFYLSIVIFLSILSGLIGIKDVAKQPIRQLMSGVGRKRKP
ncbi:MAG: hypothetical protein ACM3SY_02815 [Candidatus Omnitrophota bacterium]